MLDQKDLQAIAELLKPINERLDKLDQGQNELRADVAMLKENVNTLQEDVEIIKEDVQVTRNATNTLLDWAEQAQLEVKIPLYKKLNNLHRLLAEGSRPRLFCCLILVVFSDMFAKSNRNIAKTAFL